jgi:hypothetical protein
MHNPLSLPDSPPLFGAVQLKSYQLRISIVLCVFLVLFGIYTVMTTTRIAVQTYSPVIYWDQWSTVDNLMHSGDQISWSQLWAQHNEHRIPVARVACFADLLLFGGRNISLLIEIYLVQLFHLLIFAWMIWRESSLSPAARWTALGLLLFCMFSPIQIENFSWGFEVTFVMAGFAASLAFACALWYSKAARKDGSAILPLVLCLLTAFVSECSLANGTLVWPTLLFLAFALRFARGAKLLIAGAGTLAIAVYLKGYQSPGHHSNPLTSIRHPFAIAKYVVTYFAGTWDPSLPSTSVWPTISESLTGLAIGVALLSAFRVFRKSSSVSRLEIFLSAEMIFVLMSAIITALGRVDFGTVQATASRYQTIALVFWASLGLLLLSWCGRSVSRNSWLIQFQVCVMVLLMASASRFGLYQKFASDRQASLAIGYAALATGSADQESLRLLFPAPQLLPAWYQYLRAHNLGPDPRKYGSSVQRTATVIQPGPGSEAPRIVGYQLITASRCSGFFDAANPVSGRPGWFAVGGWAWDSAANKPPVKVVLVESDGTVAGAADLGASRPDVPKAVPQIRDANTGWNGVVQLPSGAVVHAFAILADTKSACPLSNEFHTPD